MYYSVIILKEKKIINFLNLIKIIFSPPAISFGYADTTASGNNETNDDTDKNSVLNIITYDNKDRYVIFRFDALYFINGDFNVYCCENVIVVYL